MFIEEGDHSILKQTDPSHIHSEATNKMLALRNIVENRRPKLDTDFDKGGYWRQQFCEWWDGLLVAPIQIKGTQNGIAYVAANWQTDGKNSQILFTACKFESLTGIGPVPNLTFVEDISSDTFFIKRFRRQRINDDNLPLVELSIVDRKRGSRISYKANDFTPETPNTIRFIDHDPHGRIIGTKTHTDSNFIDEYLNKYPYPQLLQSINS